MKKRIIVSIIFMGAFAVQSVSALAVPQLPPTNPAADATNLTTGTNETNAVTVDPTTTSTTSTDTASTSTSSDNSSTSASASADNSSSGFQDFTDVPIDQPDYNAILLLRYNGIITGYPDNTFRPNNSISRVEALKLIFVASDLGTQTGIGPVSFSDTEDNTWYTPYLNHAIYLEIVSGYPDNTFKPAQVVNKVEFLKMLLKANNVNLSDLNMLELPYADALPGQWYSKYLMYAKMFSLLDPDKNNNIQPGAALTRGDAAQIIYRFRNIQSENKLHPVLNSNNQTAADSTTSTAIAPSNLLTNFALFVSQSSLFAVQYPKNWFYEITNNNIVDPNDPYYSNILTTYYFGPQDLTLNPPAVTLELLSRTAAFQGDHVYHDIPYYQTTSPDQKMVIITSPPASKRLYRFSGDSSQEQNMLDMMSTITEQTSGLSSYNPAEASPSATTDSSTTVNASTTDTGAATTDTTSATTTSTTTQP